MLDLLITNGRIVDGTGSPWYLGTVGIKDGKICGVFRSEDKQPAKQVIDAKGKVIAPGFIDMHSHADLAVLRDPGSLGRLRQGVTTQVIGNCGLSVAPMTPKTAVLLSEGYEAILGSYPTWQWNESWWEVYGQNHRLYVLAVRNGDGVISGIAPFYLARRSIGPAITLQTLVLIGSNEDSGILDILALPGEKQKVWNAVLEFLGRSSDWDILQLSNLDGKLESLELVEQQLEKRGWLKDRFQSPQLLIFGL